MSVALFWDIGLKNLSVCAYCTTTHEILLWDVCDTGVRGKCGLSQIVQKLVQFLAAFVESAPFRCVHARVVRNVIENQPKMNPTMRVVSGIVGTFFYTRFRWAPLYFNPAYKLMHVDFGAAAAAAPAHGGGRRRPRRNTKEFATAYRMRKIASIDETRRILEASYASTPWLAFFERHTKKDDLADTFLMARVYARTPAAAIVDVDESSSSDEGSEGSEADPEETAGPAGPAGPACPVASASFIPKVRKYAEGSWGHAKFCIEERLHKEYGQGAAFVPTVQKIVGSSKCKGIAEFRAFLQTCSCGDCRDSFVSRMFPEAHWSRMFVSET